MIGGLSAVVLPPQAGLVFTGLATASTRRVMACASVEPSLKPPKLQRINFCYRHSATGSMPSLKLEDAAAFDLECPPEARISGGLIRSLICAATGWRARCSLPQSPICTLCAQSVDFRAGDHHRGL